MNFILHRKILISMLFVASTLLGFISYKQLKVEIFPNAEFPMLYVQISSRMDVTPEFMEEKAVIPVEGVVSALENIERIESTAGRRNGVVYITYEKKTDLKYAYLRLDEAINILRTELPEEFTLQIVKIDMEATADNVITIQALGSGGVDRIRNILDQKIVPELENIDGVAGVNVYGGRQKSVEILLNRSACEAYNITPTRVRNILSRSMNLREYGGTILQEGKRYFVFLDAEYQDISHIEDLVIGRRDNPVLLKDVAEIFYGVSEEETLSRVDGKDAVSLTIMNDAQSNIIEISHAVRRMIMELNQKYQFLDVTLIIQEDSGHSMERNINQIINLALTGGLLAIFFLWVFLRNIRLVTVVALAIPISVFTAFNFFYGFDISINSLTLVGIVLAIGMLIDNSVVVLENIYRLRALGMTPVVAATRGTKEVWRSIVAATLTTIAVFIPFIFSSNNMVQLLGKHIGISIISTLVISLIVSLMLIPMAVHSILSLKRKEQHETYRKLSLDNHGVRFYLFLLKTALRNPAPTIIGGLILFFATILTSMSVSVNQLSELETTQIRLNVTMPTGSTLEKTDEVVRAMEAGLSDIDEKEQIIANISEEEAEITVLLKEDFGKINNRNYGEIESDIYNRVKDLPASDISINATSGRTELQMGGAGGGSSRGGGATDFQRMMGIGEDEEYIVLKGQDFSLMSEVAEDLRSFLEELDNINMVRLSIRENQPEVHMMLDSRIMTSLDIARNQVMNELGNFQGEVESGVTFRQGEEEYEIMIKFADATDMEASDKTMNDLRSLPIPDASDENLHELQDFANIYYARGRREISRVNQEKQIELRYQYIDDVYESKSLLKYAREEIEDVILQTNIPSGIAVEMIQEESGIDEFKWLFLVALLLIYMILAAIFESFVTPFVLLFSVPLAAIGSFFLLTITGNSLFNANTFTGFLILLGVVVNNGIILIDFINILRKQGYRRSRAILEGGLARVRPILITAITTCAAMLPLALGNAEYVKAIGPPFAVTVIGGLSVSTLLTLIYIPMLYNGLEHAMSWLKRLKWPVKLSLISLQATGMLFVVLLVDSFVWQMGSGLLIIIGIPVAFWFITASLRKAAYKIIPEAESLNIKIANLIKIYGRESKMVRDFLSGRKLVKKDGPATSVSRQELESLIWQIPVLAFLIYFTWFYLVSGFWQLVAAIGSYGFALAVLNRFRKPSSAKWLSLLYGLLLYVAPLFILAVYHLRWRNPALTILIAVLWYFCLAVGYVSAEVHRASFQIRHVRKAFRWFFHFVSILPVVGMRKERFKALKGVSLDIRTGMFGLLGPNGAGKSTMMRIICGILEQSYGKIWINGIDTQEKREELQGLIGYLPQEFGMYENMTAQAYLDYQAMMKGISEIGIREKRIRECLESVHMWDQRHRKISTYSGGMKQRIGIAQVLLHLPRILVVDEPTAGLDPRERIRFRNLLVELSRNRIVIFSTHIIEDISSSCNTMAVINMGEVLFRGSPKELTEIARGKVWNVSLPASEFEEQTKNLLVIHHMRDKDRIKVRCISGSKPFENAEEDHPLLEDAYIWLLKSSKDKIANQ
ncbi:MAG: efflux RND transporter permease subunit [Bacteroidales bacterium]|nr:efflux RND transporter permease subunit [Bacteroidales bacterium]